MKLAHFAYYSENEPQGGPLQTNFTFEPTFTPACMEPGHSESRSPKVGLTPTASLNPLLALRTSCAGKGTLIKMPYVHIYTTSPLRLMRQKIMGP